MSAFRELLTDGRVHLFDGAYGTQLMARGLPPGVSPEVWGLANPEVVAQVHRDYLKAGAEVLTTNTFGGSAPKLPPGTDVAGLNREMCRVARRVADERAGDRAFVAASIGPTGLFVRPLGEISFAELVAVFAEQIKACAEGGADLILGETLFDLAEAKAVAVAARQVCDLPVGLSMTFEQGRCLTGTDPAGFVATAQNLGVDLVATNCSAGPDQIKDAVRAMGRTLSIPLYVAANAGLPELDGDGTTVFRLGPEPFAEKSAGFIDLGAKFLGGCCGTGPDHIRALARAVQGASWQRPHPERPALITLTSRTGRVDLGLSHPTAIIGERINPTGKAALTAELQAGTFAEAVRLAQEQAAQGAAVLDVNVGAPMVDEPDVLPRLVETLTQRVDLPLCLDTSNPEAMAAALQRMPGSPLVNSISGEPGRLEELGPLCARTGSPFILLPLAGKKLPVTAAERIEIIENLLAKAWDLNIPKRLIMVDVLALTVSSKSEAAKACLETIRHCTEEFGVATVLGLSNISFGLPARELVNATFLAMCMGVGLSACIANPGSARLMEALAAGEVLLGRDAKAESFIHGYSGWTGGTGSGGQAPTQASGAQASGESESGESADPLYRAVLGGARDEIDGLVRQALERDRAPFALVNEHLIPAIMEVGERYERKDYFLPQLIASAETLQKALAILEPLLEEGREGAARHRVVMATVQGDIHDIGKNIVCLMLKNHGFEVIDLGKDVPAETVVDRAEESGAGLIGLSALMTTTMVRMEDTVRLVRERGLDCRVMLGGAVVTESFAEAIGADGFALDAVGAVRLAKRLTGQDAPAH